MSDERTPEIATKFGAIDSASQFSGAPVDAAYLRALAVNANRLACKGHQAFRFFFSCDTSVPYPGDLRAFAPTAWYPITRAKVPIFKKPGLTSYEIQCMVQVETAGDVLWLQFVTRATNGGQLNPFATTTGANILTIPGTGGIQLATIFNVPADPGISDEISVYALGPRSFRPGDTVTYGVPRNGAIIHLENSGDFGTVIIQPFNTWNMTGNTWASGGHTVELVDTSSGKTLAGPHLIVDVDQITTPVTAWAAGRLWVSPKFTSSQIQRYGAVFGTNVDFSIWEAPKLRVFDIVGHLADRTR